MNPIHKTIFLGMIVLCIIPAINAQEILTLGRAIEIAETGSPDLKRSMLNLEQFPKSYRVFYNVYMAQMNLNIAKEELANT